MRDIILIREKCAFKTLKKPPVQKKKWETIENSTRERSAKFGRTNNAPGHISESTVGWCWYLDICFFSHYSTNWLEGFDGTQSVWQNSSSAIFWKTKGNTPVGQFWSPTDFSLFHCWSMPIFGYVVHAPRCCLHSGRWRSETHSPARCYSRWTVARPFSG
jgi:hypothetical protein